MENDKIRTSRASQSRSQDTRPKTWTPPSSLMHHLRQTDLGTDG